MSSPTRSRSEGKWPPVNVHARIFNAISPLSGGSYRPARLLTNAALAGGFGGPGDLRGFDSCAHGVAQGVGQAEAPDQQAVAGGGGEHVGGDGVEHELGAA